MQICSYKISGYSGPKITDENNEECVGQIKKLEDLKVLRRSPDLLNNVKMGQGQLQLIMEQI